jgi:fatty acid desaturase
MKTDKQALREIAEKFKQASNIKGFCAIASNWVWFFFYAFIINQTLAYNTWDSLPIISYFIYVLCAYRIAYRFRGFECLIHEGSHQTLFATSSWNTNLWMQFLFAYIVWRPVQVFAKWHNIHHRFQGNKELDPDEQQNERWGLYSLDVDTTWVKIWKLIFRQMTGWQTYYYLRFCFISFIDDTKMKTNLIKIKEVSAYIPVVVFWVVIFSFVSLTGTWLLFFLVYVIPFFIVLPIIRFYAEGPEHTGFGIELGSIFRSSRNKLGWLNSWGLHPFNDAIHQPHHTLLPYTPWFNLPEAYAEMQKLEHDEASESRAIEDMWAIQTIVKHLPERKVWYKKMVVSKSPWSAIYDMMNLS